MAQRVQRDPANHFLLVAHWVLGFPLLLLVPLVQTVLMVLMVQSGLVVQWLLVYRAVQALLYYLVVL
jgi:hypothetical protein